MTQAEREARQNAVDLRRQARMILDQAQTEKRDVTPDEENRVGELIRQAEELEDKITKGEFAKEERTMPETVKVETPVSEDVMEFRDFLRGKKVEGRALKSSVDAAGGVMAPEGFVAEVIKKLNALSVMRQVARVITIAERSTRIPRLITGVTAAWTEEAAAITPSEPTFDQVELTPHKLAALTQVSNELLSDAALPVETFLAELFGEELAAKEDAAFFNGDGNNKPTGILTDASIPTVAAGADNITPEDIFALWDALEPQYRANAAWVMNPATLGAIRRLQDNTGRYLLVDSLAAGAPDTLLGRPVYLSANMPTIGAGAKSIILADFQRAYYIADRQGMDVQRSVDRYFEQDVTAFRAIVRTDGKVALPEAARILVHAA